ncbi:DHHC zinc finger membrane protein [Mucor ambiguus]|uniref:DHHC zinc finger membrane protein n=1 Tax=Mucor ambiguus TaxID=91626 RepID=A0A0C9MV81_9FUNG|nr:DHHC zinc finger membrane protein [Mucor ambiguus]
MSNTPSNPLSTATTAPKRLGHARKLSHVQFGKRSFVHDEYTISSSLMIPFDEIHPPPSVAEHKKGLSFSSDITATAHLPLAATTSDASSSIHNPEKPTKRQYSHWLLSASYWGPFSKGDHWPLFTYLMAIFMIIIFSGEILLSKQSSGEFFELEPFNYMLGPSMEIMIQVGARFAPCMRLVDSMPPDERYVCLHTIAEKNKTPSAAAAATAVAALGKGSNNNNTTLAGGQSLLLLDQVVNLADPRLLNSSCSLSSICGMTTFHQNQVPDQTYRLLTPLFIHTGMIHLLINLAVLVILGAKVERIINSLRFSLLYIGSGVFGHALGANFAPPTTPFLGCSSSLFGLFGFLYVDLLHNWKHLEQPIRYLIKLLLGTALSFILGLLPGVDNFSHMGGLLAGVILSLLLWPPIQLDVRNESKKKLAIFYLARLLCLCLYGLLLGILVHHFTTSKIDEVREPRAISK